MEIEFENVELADIYQGNKVPKGYQPSIVKAFLKAVRILQITNAIEDLYKYNSLRFEALRGNRHGFFSVRVNDQYRLIFKQRQKAKNTVIVITELSNHYK